MNHSKDEFLLASADNISALVDQLNTKPDFELVRVFEHDDNNRAYALLRRVSNGPTRAEYRLVRKTDYPAFAAALNVQARNGFELAFLFEVSGDPCAVMRRLSATEHDAPER